MAYAQRRVTSPGAVRWYATYFTPDSRQMAGGGYSTKRDAERAADKLEKDAEVGAVADRSRRKITFANYVATFYWPAAKHLEPTTLAAYRSNLDKHFLPRFVRIRMAQIVASEVQAWVNDASAAALSPRSVVKYHTFLHAIFERAVIDQVIPVNPCRHTVLPKLVKKPKSAITPEQFDALVAEIPDEFRLTVLVAIETGVRWGELAALRPIDIDFSRNVVLVQRVVLEVPKKLTGADIGHVLRDYPRTTSTARSWSAPSCDARSASTCWRTASARTTCSSRPAPERPYRATPSAPGSGCRQSNAPGCAGTSASTTYAAPTPRCYSPAAPTSRSSWTARGQPPRRRRAGAEGLRGGSESPPLAGQSGRHAIDARTVTPDHQK